MKPVRKMKLTGPMASSASKNIFDVLQHGQNEAVVLFVGGCVRNALLGEDVSDIDLATKFTPQTVMALLKKAGIKVIPTGIGHGTVTAVLEGQEFQITTLRKDVETDGRHAIVVYTDDWVEDARRRDFTLNTLLADIDGRIFDPLGRGIGDLEKRKIIFVGEPSERIQEDYLRILRFFRFSSIYGKGRPDVKALAACKTFAQKIKTLSKERVTSEFLKIITSPSSGKTLRLMRDNNVLKDLINLKFQETHFNYLKKLGKDKNYILTMLVAAGFSNLGTKRIVSELRLSNIQKKTTR